MEITVKRDVKINSDDVLKRLSKYMDAPDQRKMQIVQVDKVLLKDAYDLLKYFSDKEKCVSNRYCVGNIENIELYCRT